MIIVDIIPYNSRDLAISGEKRSLRGNLSLFWKRDERDERDEVLEGSFNREQAVNLTLRHTCYVVFDMRETRFSRRFTAAGR